MANTETQAPQVLVGVDATQYANQQLAREMEAMRKSGRKLDEATVPGGYFIGTDGEPHDAHGLKINAKAAASEQDPMERLRALDAERAALVTKLELQQARAAEASHAGAEDGPSEAAEKAGRKAPPKARR